MAPALSCAGRRVLSALVAAMMIAAAAVGALAPAASAESVAPGLYLVTLAQPPAATYLGGISGYAATRPDPGQRFDAQNPAVRRYRQLLRLRQDRLLGAVGSPDVVYRYTTALNGFAARLTSTQVKRLRATAGVVAVERSVLAEVTTVHSPDFLGLRGSAGAWAGYGGPARAGAGVVVGVVDTGIWPENPSFAGAPTGPGRAPGLPGFGGACRPGAESWSRQDCDAKIVSARYFVSGFGAEEIADSDYLSPRDGTGHGSHTAAIAAGNSGVDVVVDGERFGAASGMAPAARIAVYKACWTAPDPDDDGCATADTVKALDQAVADGVDVLSYSISGTRTELSDAVQTTFRGAATAGVFVAASAGNDGPAEQAVSHPSPWVTTVGASSQRPLRGAVVLGDMALGTDHGPRRELVGAMISDTAVAPAPLVLGAGVATGMAYNRGRLCFPGALDATEVAGAIVVCERGVNPRADKSLAVFQAGGVGMVLVNTGPDSVDADVHAVPTVHLDEAAGRAVSAYVATADGAADVASDGAATAALDPDVTGDVRIPRVAAFSARGPSAATRSLLKPDVAAPGVSILAAVAPPSDNGRLWDARSGTSMAAAHVAGLAAFVRGVEPTWSPATVKSALMTTADPIAGSGPFAAGAGNVDARTLLDPGLLYASEAADWGRLIDGSTAARNLNLASVAVNTLAGRTSVIRTVTNLARRRETYTAAVHGVPGVDVAIRPDTLTVRPGASRRFTVRFTVADDVAFGEFATGDLVWSGSHGHEVRSPLAVRPVRVHAPSQVRAAASTGWVDVAAEAGLTGWIDPSVTGLAGATPESVALTPDPMRAATPATGPGTYVARYDVPPATPVVRFEVSGEDEADDLDLYVYRDGELVASAVSGAADERVTLRRPPAGDYRVYANAYSAADGATVDARYTGWVIDRTYPTDGFVVTPKRIDTVRGKPLDFTASWPGLDPDQRWLGVVSYGGAAAADTLITLD